jgi:hypothetical protein
VSAAATAVREDHDACRMAGYGQVTVQDHSGSKDLNRTLKITAHESSVSLPVSCIHWHLLLRTGAACELARTT